MLRIVITLPNVSVGSWALSPVKSAVLLFGQDKWPIGEEKIREIVKDP